ncbi:MAG: hypothetical protein L0Y71_10575 [Gemmataceae bacterium]|nr:hypothetical protein [Gemmataceae bacterium]
MKTCIPFARNHLIKSSYPGDMAFLDNLAAQGAYFGNNMFLCTAGGKLVAGHQDRNLNGWLANWSKLPMSDRQPGVASIEDRGARVPQVRDPQPPADGMFVRTFMRALDRNSQGQFVAPDKLSLGISKTVIKAEPNRDGLWLTADDWKSLVLADPKVGDVHQVPAAIRQRIFRFHLVDGACCLPGFWQPKQVQGGSIQMTVTEVTPADVSMKIDGWAKLGAKDAPTEFTLAGAAGYDRASNKFNRFDVVALSATPCHKDTASGRPMYLGIAFQLARPNVPLDIRTPFRIWYDDYGQRDYLGN